MKESKVGIRINEFGGKRRVLMEAMEEESSMDLLKVLWFCAEIQYRRGCVEKPCCLKRFNVGDFENVIKVDHV